MPHAIRIHAHGGPEVLQWEAIERPAPGPGEVLIRQTAIGLNFIDVYERTGLYPSALPMGPVARAPASSRPSDRRCAASGGRAGGLCVSAQPGSYAQERVMPADRVVRIPDGVSDRLAAAAMLKGLTAQFLLRRTYRVAQGRRGRGARGGRRRRPDRVAVGSHLGATVIGVVGSDAKAAVAREHGCHHVARVGRDDLPRACGS
jgi:NADPH:quinone reductase